MNLPSVLVLRRWSECLFVVCNTWVRVCECVKLGGGGATGKECKESHTLTLMRRDEAVLAVPVTCTMVCRVLAAPGRDSTTCCRTDIQTTISMKGGPEGA